MVECFGLHSSLLVPIFKHIKKNVHKLLLSNSFTNPSQFCFARGKSLIVAAPKGWASFTSEYVVDSSIDTNSTILISINTLAKVVPLRCSIY